jgi:hypothetical protein
LEFTPYAHVLCFFFQAGSLRGDAYLGKLGQLEKFASILISRTESQWGTGEKLRWMIARAASVMLVKQTPSLSPVHIDLVMAV